MKRTSLSDDARIALENLGDYAASFINANVRLGVTGLARSGKTVFISALVHNLLNGGHMPFFKAYADGRVSRAYLQPQPDDAVPRFRYEDHVARLTDDLEWPDSTSRISQLRLTIDFESASLFSRALGGGRLHVDIVDYPGEWLLDLPLLEKDYATWSREALDLARSDTRRETASAWLDANDALDHQAPADEKLAQDLAALFTDYLRNCRSEQNALSMLPPGRFLMPGDLAGSPAVTFVPLDRQSDAPSRSSLWGLMERRYEAYKSVVVRPFFRDHFARLDRQIVLVDALSALNGGIDAVRDLEAALTQILVCFQPGRNTWLSSILSRRIDRILFAATKADHLHQVDHDNLANLLRVIVARAIERAKFAGAEIDVAAIASVRATREATFQQDAETLHCIAGVPQEGERIDGTIFDGKMEKAIFPGRLDLDLRRLLKSPSGVSVPPLRFVKFRPPQLETGDDGVSISLPHIRLDKALEFLIGDKLI